MRKMFEDGVPFFRGVSIMKIVLRGICGDDGAAHADTVHASEEAGKKDRCEVHNIPDIVRNKLHNPGAHFYAKICWRHIEKVKTMCYLAP